MAICKECGTKNPDDFKFCSNCGSSLATIDAAAVQAALDKVEKEFEKDAKVSLDRSRLTYICDICGKVNPIDTPNKRCSRCGKKMPRTEYIKALKAIKEARNVQDGILAERDAEPAAQLAAVAPAQQPAPQQPAPAQQPAPQQVQQPAPQQQEQQVVYRMGNGVRPAVQSPSQNGQIIQPFVIVPYVSQNQPVLQYNPNTVYRYHEYTEDEKRRNQETLARIQREREEAERQRVKDAERLARIEREAQARLDADNARREKKFKRRRYDEYAEPKSNARITAFFTVFFSLAFIFLVFLIDFLVTNMTIADKRITFALSESVLFSDVARLLVSEPEAFLTSYSIGQFVSIGGQLVFGLAMLVLAVFALVRLFKGELAIKGWGFALVALLGTVATYVGCCFNASNAFSFDGLTALFPDYAYCMIAMVAAPLLAIILEASTRVKPKYY